MGSEPSQPANMKTIAHQAGVSVMTVSRALRNHPEIKKETRDRIQKIAKEIGYRKHPYVTALMAHRRDQKPIKTLPIIGLIHCLPHSKSLTLNMKAFRASAQRRARSLGFEIEEFYLNEPGMTHRRQFEILQAKNIKGVIIEHFTTEGNTIDADLSDFAIVEIGNTVSKPSLNRIDRDYNGEIQLAMKKLVEYGYRRPCLINLEGAEKNNHFCRRAAFLHGQLILKNEDRLPTPLGIEQKSDFEQIVEEWIRDFQPDCVLSMHLEISQAIRKLGLRIPHDIGFIHLDLSPKDKPFAGINPNWPQMGIAAINQVASEINHNEFGIPSKPTCTFVDYFWEDGESIRFIANAPPLEGLLNNDFSAPFGHWKKDSVVLPRA